jgi:amidophosphoribosyltransferase
MGLIKNQYIARTFIQPTQALREQGVKMKLAPVRGVVSGKNIVVVDDSIVRGTTSRQIVQMLKEAGAKSVHMRIASPPFKYPHFYGIDISERKDLMAAKYSVSDMCKLIGADSLGFLSIPSLIKAVDMPDAGDAPNGGLTVAYFDGKYPTPLYDYEEQIKEPLNVESVEEILKKQNRGE